VIHTIESLRPGDGPPAERVPRFWADRIAHVRWIPPEKFAPGIAVPAEVAQSRWLARCPDEDCAGAELVSKVDPRFWCCSCQNAHVGGLWLRVVFPKNHEQIEALLLERPSPNNRSWNVGESVRDLKFENLERGIGL